MRIAIIDHSFHAKTKSSDFFYEIISKCGSVDKFLCDRWEGGGGIDIQMLATAKYDAIIFWQQMYRRRELNRLGDPRKIILVPMYDGVADWDERKWRRYRPFPIVSFSRTLHNAATKAGCRSVCVRYFPSANTFTVRPNRNRGEGWTVFFWERQQAISWSVVRELLRDLPVARVYYKPCPDPGMSHSKISEEDRRRFKVKEIGWLTSREAYLQLVGDSQIYIAPRRYEGIGMSFLEAMGAGAIVVAPNNATMNEYIEHRRNGILYNLEDPRLDLSEYDLTEMMERVRESSQRFAAEWLHDQEVVKTVVRAAGGRRRGRWASCGRWLRRSLGRLL